MSLITLGVTGGIGSGKSTVCRMLEDLGARVFYADEEARRLMQEDAGARNAIVAAFGPESYDAQGRLNRAYLARQVFGHPDRLEVLNRIVHPRVFAAFERARAAAEQDGMDVLVHEAALIFESGADAHLDAVVVVEAPEDVRIRRVVERDGTTPGHVRARMAHQLPPEELRRRADYVIENTGSPDDLRRQVEALWHEIRSSPRPS
ncbi:MAG: dephospho-CoA kinase [Bacteroidetes bacterium]|nr:MAG: dephospho-CoA kinase [Bacteroidota bacterium]